MGTGAFATLPAVKVTFSNDLSVTFQNDGTNIAWSTELFDTAAMHSNSHPQRPHAADGAGRRALHHHHELFAWESQGTVFFFSIDRTTAAGRQTLAIEERGARDRRRHHADRCSRCCARASTCRSTSTPARAAPDLLGRALANEVPSFAMTWVGPAPAP